MILALGAIIVAIWMLAIYGTIQEEHEKRYDVTVRPGAVSYGTHSFATMPMVSALTRHTAAPMISGSAVRSYAHYGHATMPGSAVGSGFKMHTTSSATVHTVGSGGASGGLSSSPSGDRGASSSRGLAYGGGSVSMPTLALATTSFASSSVAETAGTTRYGMGPRRMPSAGDGDEGDWVEDTDGWWYKGEDGWVAVKLNDTRLDPLLGYTVIWNGSEWVKLSEYDPGVPLGDAPWHWMLLLALGYGIAKMRRRKHVFLPKVG